MIIKWKNNKNPTGISSYRREYGSGFDKTSISRMIKFYQEFPDFEKGVTLSQQLTWSHFVEILPI